MLLHSVPNIYFQRQDNAKKAVAVALRNRWRRKNVAKELQDEIVPKNILMIGSTGVGKTEIARRLAKLASAPFIKVEATKFTEIGYVGRDVDSIIRDLLDIAIAMTKTQKKAEVIEQAKINSKNRIINNLVGAGAGEETREKFLKLFHNGQLDDKEIEIEVQEASPNAINTLDIPGMPGAQMGVLNIGDMIGKAIGGGPKMKLKKMTVAHAYKVILDEESERLIDEDKIIKSAINAVENDGIVFLDEIDKIASRQSSKGEVSREGVQRDLLPLIEGTNVPTKYGQIKTDYILFIASGAFHLAKPSDLLPELQGRLPIRVELSALSKQDMIRILTEPEANIIKQYIALLATENFTLEITPDAIEKIADVAIYINKEVENIGARRLHTLIEKLLEDISYNASERVNEKFVIDAAYVDDKLKELVKRTDISNFIL